MTEISYSAEKTDHINPEVRDYVAAKLYSLQQARLNTVNSATLEDLFRGRNLYYLRASGQAAHQLMRDALDSYLAIEDEAHFVAFQNELESAAARYKLPQPKPSDIIDHVAPDNLPLRFEIQDAYSRAYNRLTHKFFADICDEDAGIDWQRLTRFIVENDAAS